MIDASAKLHSGFAEGNIVDFGSYDECLSINEYENSTGIKGKYCLAKVLFKNIPIVKLAKYQKLMVSYFLY